MDLTDLLADPVLHLVLHTPTATQRLARPVSWCAPTELLDPSAYLTTNALVLTTGMGLNFRDLRTWDAYAERLARVPVSGIVFSTGDAHGAVPAGLVEAAGAHDVPVLELMADVPTLLLMRHVESALATERFRTAQRAWDLADSCARLAAEGVDVTALLDHLEDAAGGPVALTDPAGAVLFASRGRQEGEGSTTTARRLPLPGDLAGQCSLVVPAAVGRDVAGPAAAIVAMHVAQSLGGTAAPGAAQPFVDALLAPGATARAVDEAVEAAGLHPARPAVALCLDLGEAGVHAGTPAAPGTRRVRHFQLWRIRSVLEAEGLAVRQAGAGGVRVLVVQGASVARPARLDALFERLRGLAGEHRIGGALTPVAAAPRDLRTSLPVALAEARAGGAMTRPGEQTLLELVARSAPIGARDLAADLLDRLRREDPSGVLLRTLEAVVGCGGQRGSAAAALGVHRNTLTGRLQRIRSITGWDLADGETLAALAVALRLVRV
ncbi:PucR family transcriptional regulator [Kocuria flava]|uniref:helix-turn-helix domain-containing protein n=1 Tax=Kocuria flava TaxID=446860 RepID=UPI001FF33E02|nr:PucR family transcriptional regulator [Kocuria flava]MCJ8503534.1 PucR family transcriptional regulator [Kocuria flava]